MPAPLVIHLHEANCKHSLFLNSVQSLTHCSWDQSLFKIFNKLSLLIKRLAAVAWIKHSSEHQDLVLKWDSYQLVGLGYFVIGREFSRLTHFRFGVTPLSWFHLCCARKSKRPSEIQEECSLATSEEYWEEGVRSTYSGPPILLTVIYRMLIISSNNHQ